MRPQVHYASAPTGNRLGETPAAAKFRASVASKLGLPNEATNEEIFATFDATTASAPAEASLYEKAWGNEPTAQTPQGAHTPADALYQAAFGGAL